MASVSISETKVINFEHLPGSTSKAKSLAHAFGKLRLSSKSKKVQHAGDFKVANQHEEFIKNSLKLRSEQAAAEAYANATKGQSTPHDDCHNHAPEPLPFLIRKLLKLYFIKPPPGTVIPNSPFGTLGSFYLPSPSMALPTLPATRRLKAVIPGARIQVQIQIPSLIPIPGYAQTSMLVPDPKKGGLVPAKGHISHQHHTHDFSHQLHHPNIHHHGQIQEPDSKYVDNFHVALTIRKVTRRDINKNDALRKRIEGAAVASGARVSPFAVNDSGYSTVMSASSGATSHKRLLSSNMSESSLDPDVNPTAFKSSPNEFTNPSLTVDKGCRKEIRVRKIKCEFWQKETCRIPTSNQSVEGQSRTAKYALGTAFTYSEKEQDKENRNHRASFQLASPQRTPMHQLSGGAVSWDAAVAGNGFGVVSTSGPIAQAASMKGDSSAVPLRKDSMSTIITPLSPQQVPSSPQVAADFEPKDSTASLTSSTPVLANSSPTATQQQRQYLHQQATQHQPSRPFMLLIPVPLDSPRLRQSFVWPSTEVLASVPSPLSHEPVASAMPTSLLPHSSGVRGGKSHDAAQDLSETPGVGAFGTTAGPPSASSCDSIVGPLEDVPHLRHHHHVRGSVVSGVPSNIRTSASGNVVPFTGYSLSAAQRPHHGLYAGAPVKTRMEVKHYLNFRLSIDILEFEGEQELDEDHDLEALEEEQLQAVKSRQALSAYGHSHNGSDHTTATATTITSSSAASSPSAKYPKTATHTSNLGDADKPKLGGATARTSLKAAGSSHTLLPSALDVPASPSGVQQPTLGFLNSTVGLLDLADLDFENRDLADHGEASRRGHHCHQQHSRVRSSSQGAFAHSQNSPRPFHTNSSSALSTSSPHTSLIGAFYDNEQCRGSTASLGTVLSSQSGSSSPSGHSSIKPGAFVAGALGALKKKASSAGLSTVASTIAGGARGTQDATHSFNAGASVPTVPSHHQHHSPQTHRSSAATVRKLKDFVIRVPITVVVQVDDMSRIGTYYKVDGSETMTVTEASQEDGHVGRDDAMGANVAQEALLGAATGTIMSSKQRRGFEATVQTVEDTGGDESEVDCDEEIVGQFLP